MRQKIITLAQSGNYRTKIAIAREVGVSHQWVGEVLKKEGVLLPKLPPNLCLTCGGVVGDRWHKYCSRACYIKAKTFQPRITKYCEVCNNPITRPIYLFRTISPGRFCSHKCHAIKVQLWKWRKGGSNGSRFE